VEPPKQGRVVPHHPGELPHPPGTHGRVVCVTAERVPRRVAPERCTHVAETAPLHPSIPRLLGVSSRSVSSAEAQGISCSPPLARTLSIDTIWPTKVPCHTLRWTWHPS